LSVCNQRNLSQAILVDAESILNYELAVSVYKRIGEKCFQGGSGVASPNFFGGPNFSNNTVFGTPLLKAQND